MKTCWERRYCSTSLDICTRCRCDQLHVADILPPGDRRLDTSQSRSKRCGYEKNLLPLSGIETRPSSPQRFSRPTELSRLRSIHGEIKNAYTVLVWMDGGRNCLEDIGVDGKVILKWNIIEGCKRMDWVRPFQGRFQCRTRVCDNEPSYSVKWGV
jgi:hypothetical protein